MRNTDWKMPLGSTRSVLGITTFYAVLTAGLVAIHCSLMNYVFDDTYIHFRIARNLVHYGAPYFNPDSPVMTSSSPVWTLLLAGLFRLFGENIVLVSLLNALITVAVIFVSALAVMQIAQGACPRIWCHVLTAALVAPLLMYSSIGLMETPLALLLLVLGQYLLLRGIDYGFLFLTLAIFVRLELCVFLAVIFAYHLLSRQLTARSLIWIVIPLAVFSAYNVYFHGTVLSHTAQVKLIVFDLSREMVAWGAFHGIFGSLPASELEKTGKIVWLVAILLAMLIVLVFHRDEAGRIASFWLLPSIGIAACYVGLKVFLQVWYVPLYAVPFALATLATAMVDKTRFVLVLVGVGALFGAAGLKDTVYAACGHQEKYRFFVTGARVRQYVRVGEELYKQFPECGLMTSEIGGLGYGFKGKIYDACGLASPEALQYHPLKVPEERRSGIIGAIPIRYIDAVKPEIIVSLDVFVEAFLASEERHRYETIKFPLFVDSDSRISPVKNLWGSKHLTVFIRKDLIRK